MKSYKVSVRVKQSLNGKATTWPFVTGTPARWGVLWLGVLFVEWVLWMLGSGGELPIPLVVLFFVLLLLAVAWVWFGGRKKP